MGELIAFEDIALRKRAYAAKKVQPANKAQPTKKAQPKQEFVPGPDTIIGRLNTAEAALAKMRAQIARLDAKINP